MSAAPSLIPEPVIVDIGRHEVRHCDRIIRLEKLPMKLLILLVRNWDQLVSREEIAEHLWGRDVFNDTENGINTAMRKIRIAIEDDPDHASYILTVVGHGYRFIGPAVLVPPDRELERFCQQ